MRWALWIWALFSILDVKAQDPFYYQITDEQGLPSNTIYSIFQDSKGFIWLGTDNGLTRYDGRIFKLYTCASQNGKSVTQIQEDNMGNIWCLNFSGQLFRIANNQMQELNWHDSELINQVQDYYLMEDINYILLKNSNVLMYSLSQKTYQILHIPRDEAINHPIGISVSHKNSIYIYDLVSGLHNYINGKWNKIGQPELENVYKSVNISDMFFDKNNKGEIRLIYRNKGIIFNYNNFKLTVNPISRFFFNKYKLTSVFKHEDNNCTYLTSMNGLFVYNKNDSSPVHYLKGIPLSSIFIDREGNFWVSSLKNGLYVIPRMDMMHYSDSYFKNAYKMTVLGNRIFFGTTLGELLEWNGQSPHVKLILKNPVSQEIECIRKSGSNIYAFFNKGYKIYYNQTKTTVSDFTTYSGVKDLIDLGNNLFLFTTGQITTLVSNKKKVVDSLINTSWNKYRKNILPGTDFSGLELRRFRSRTAVGCKHNKYIYVGYADHLYVYDTAGNETKIIDPRGKPITAYDMYAGNDGNIYVATSDNGVIIINGKKVIKNYTTQNGLQSNLVRNIYPGNGKIWISSDKSVQYINVSTGKIYTLTKEDGLISTDIIDLVTFNNKVYITTRLGLSVFSEDIETLNKIAPKIYIHGFAVKELDTMLQPGVKIPYASNSIRFDFTGLSYKSRGNFTFKYRLTGLDSNWITTSSYNNFARYTTLKPGQFRFEVIALNEDGFESEVAYFPFYIEKPFYLTVWFITLFSISLILLIYSLYKYRLNQIEKENRLELDNIKLKDELSQSILSAVKSQMNPHFMFNSLNTIQNYIYKNEKENAIFYLGKFSVLMRMVLDMSNKDTIPLSEELKSISLYIDLEKMRFGDNLKYSIHVADDIDPEEIMIPSMIVQPYIENSIKHGLMHLKSERKLSVEFSLKEKNNLFIVIEDNGIGRKKAQVLKNRFNKGINSYSSEANRKRLEILNEKNSDKIGLLIIDKKDTQQNSTGTRVEITIPIIKYTHD